MPLDVRGFGGTACASACGRSPPDTALLRQRDGGRGLARAGVVPSKEIDHAFVRKKRFEDRLRKAAGSESGRIMRPDRSA